MGSECLQPPGGAGRGGGLQWMGLGSPQMCAPPSAVAGGKLVPAFVPAFGLSCVSLLLSANVSSSTGDFPPARPVIRLSLPLTWVSAFTNFMGMCRRCLLFVTLR